MIIINIIILYFIQIRHSDDFPSTGLVFHYKERQIDKDRESERKR